MGKIYSAYTVGACGPALFGVHCRPAIMQSTEKYRSFIIAPSQMKEAAAPFPQHLFSNLHFSEKLKEFSENLDKRLKKYNRCWPGKMPLTVAGKADKCHLRTGKNSWHRVCS